MALAHGMKGAGKLMKEAEKLNPIAMVLPPGVLLRIRLVVRIRQKFRQLEHSWHAILP